MLFLSVLELPATEWSFCAGGLLSPIKCTESLFPRPKWARGMFNKLEEKRKEGQINQAIWQSIPVILFIKQASPSLQSWPLSTHFSHYLNLHLTDFAQLSLNVKGSCQKRPYGTRLSSTQGLYLWKMINLEDKAHALTFLSLSVSKQNLQGHFSRM